MIKKHILKFFLFAFCMLATLTLTGCISVTSDTGNQQPHENGIVFKTYGDGCMVDKYIGRAANVDIPETNQAGQKVVRIDYEAFKEMKIKSVTIPATVTEIEENAFLNCEDLEKITFKGTAQQWCEIDFERTPLYQTQHVDLYIGDEVISGDIEIEGDIKNIPGWLFYGQSEITSITLPDSVEYIGDYAFYNLNKIQKITLPKNTYEVGRYAFYGCEEVKTLENLSSNLYYMGEYAFANMKQLKSVALPNSLNYIATGLFSGCENLETVTTAKTLYSIDKYAFDGCVKLKPFALSEDLQRLGDAAFRKCILLKEITLPKEIDEVQAAVFQNCTGLEKVICKSNLKEIEGFAFYGCENLKTIVKSDKTKMPSIEEFGADCFAGCKNLETFFIGENTVTIENYAFSKCEKLQEVILSDKAKKIEEKAFADCSSLVEVCIPNKDTECEYPLFSEKVHLKKITAPCDVVRTLQDKSELEEICITAGETIGANEFIASAKLKKVSIPGTITSIAGTAFEGVTSITDIYFTGTMNDWCKLKLEKPLAGNGRNLYIDDQKVIGEDCPELEIEFNTEKNFKNYICTEVSDYAFYNFSNLKKVVLHEGVKKIGAYAFANCPALREIEFGAKMSTVKAGAFENTTGVQKLNYIGTLKNWCEDVTFEDFTSTPTYYGATIYFNNTIIPENLVIDETIVYVGRYKFMNQKTLKSIKIESYKVNSNYLDFSDKFAGCSNVVYGEGAVGLFTSLMRSDKFEPAMNLETANFVAGKKGEPIGAELFKNCEKLSTIKISTYTTNIGKDAFVNTAFYNDENNWTNGILYMNTYAPSGNEYEQIYAVAAKPEAVVNGTVTISGNTRYITDYAFANMGITNIEGMSEVEIIGEGAFMNNKIKHLDLISMGLNIDADILSIAPSIKRIGAKAFANNKHMVEVAFQLSSLYTNRIDTTAFEGCDNIIFLLNRLSSSSSAFSFIPHKYMAKSTQDSQFTTHYDTDVFRIYDEGVLIVVNYKGNAETYETQGDISDIWSYAFEEENTLKSMTLGVNLKHENTILNCSALESITFTDAVDLINGKAIVGCEKLTKIYASTGTWTDGTNTFEYASEADAENFAKFVVGKDANITKIS